jgi:Methyltransferase small domain
MQSTLFEVGGLLVPSTNLIADRLSKSADGLQKVIDQKLNPSIGNQRPTHRRQRIADGMRKDGESMQLTQSWLRTLAAQHQASEVHPLLYLLRSRADVELLARISGYTASTLARLFGQDCHDSKRLTALGLSTPELVFTAILILKESAEPAVEQCQKAATVRKLHLDAIWSKAPDFFPTPDDLIAKMLRSVAINSTDRCLEPSAGSGVIAKALRDKGVTHIDCVENYYTLRQTLELQDFKLVGSNFLDMQPSPVYDKILMNPPFSKNVYADHIRHAYKFLVPGGCLVAIAPSGYTTAGNGIPKRFREWLEQLDCYQMENGREAFDEGDRPIKISTMTIVINREFEDNDN